MPALPQLYATVKFCFHAVIIITLTLSLSHNPHHVCIFIVRRKNRSSKVLSSAVSYLSISSAIPFSRHRFFQTDNQKAVLFTLLLFYSCFQLLLVLRLRKKTCSKREPLFSLSTLANSERIQILRHSDGGRV